MLPLLLPLVPIILWYLSDPSWHPLLAVIYAAVFVICLALFWRKIAGEFRALRGFGPANYAGEWLPSWRAREFQGQFNALLRRRGWRILATETLGEHRVLTVVRKDRYAAALLAVRPGEPVSQEDLVLIADRRRTAGVARACVISEDRKDLPPAWATAEQATAFLPYREFANLNDVLGFGE